MPTALTFLFPDGYVRLDHSAVGMIDELTVAGDDATWAGPFDGTLGSNATLLVRGWAFDAGRGLPGAGVVVALGGATVEAVYGKRRDDIAEMYGNARLARTGFIAAISPPARTDGTIEVQAYLVSADAQEIAPVPGSQDVDIVPADAEISFQTPTSPGFAAFAIDLWRPLTTQQPPSMAESLLVVERGATVALTGWAIDKSAGRPIRGVYLIVDERDVVRGTAGKRRDDVAANFGDDALAASGFEIRFDTAGLAAGIHRLRLGLVSWDGTAHERLDLMQRLEILPSLRP